MIWLEGIIFGLNYDCEKNCMCTSIYKPLTLHSYSLPRSISIVSLLKSSKMTTLVTSEFFSVEYVEVTRVSS